MNLERRAPRRERQRARRALTPDPDGLRLLTSTDGVDFARAAVGQCGGEVISARLDHIDHQPGRGTSVLYSCDVNWPGSRRLELVGLTWRAGGLNPADLDAEVFHDDNHEVAAWIYPEDPDLPGLARATVVDQVLALLLEHRLVPVSCDASQLSLQMVSYRPRARVVGAAADTAPAEEPTHGDFHEGQLFLSGGRVSGLLDVEAAGPGRRVDDLACMIAHLSTVQHMDAGQAARTEVLIRRLLASFDARVDPVQLRLRAAGVAISLASGPYQEQAPDWKHQTLGILAGAENLIRRAEQL